MFIFQVHDVLEAQRTSSHRALPDPQLLRDAARCLQTPKCPLNDYCEDSTPWQGCRKGKTIFPAPPYQLYHYSPFTKAILCEGKSFYRLKCITEDPFPAGEVWVNQGIAAQEHAIAAKPDAFAAGEKCSSSVFFVTKPLHI